MNMTEDMLEMLIGRYIDGEITPSEQGMLDATLENDARARELLEQLEELHQSSAAVVASEVLERGNSAELIIERAWAKSRMPLRRTILKSGYLRFAAGVAAGLLIGLALHFALSNGPAATRSESGPDIVATDIGDQIGMEKPGLPFVGKDVIRNVDYYGFTDRDGGQWLIEGLRENMVRPAVYYGDL